MRDGRASIILSITSLEETLARALTDPEAALASLRWTINFASPSARLAKLPDDLLNEYIRAYAEGRAADPHAPENLGWLEGATPAQLPELSQMVQAARLSRRR